MLWCSKNCCSGFLDRLKLFFKRRNLGLTSLQPKLWIMCPKFITSFPFLLLPRLGWRPGRSGCRRWSPGRPPRTPSLRWWRRGTRRLAWRCDTERWPSPLRGCDCWRSYGPWGLAAGFSVTAWCSWRSLRMPEKSPEILGELRYFRAALDQFSWNTITRGRIFLGNEQ